MATTRRVVVCYGAVPAGAPPDEQDVLIEVQAVAVALERLGYEVEPLALTLDLEAARRQLARQRPLLVFNLVESIAGSGRLVHVAPALFDELGLPYTGAPLAAMFLSSNKLIGKRLLASNGLPTPAWWPAAGSGQSPDLLCPWIVKSVWEHASIGLDDKSLVNDSAALATMLAERRAQCGGDCFAEAYIDGREFNLALLVGTNGLEVLPPAEIRFADFPPGKPKIVGYAAKWDTESFEYRHTQRSFVFAPADLPLLNRLAELALRCAALFEVRGYARVDFRVDGSGQPWVLEMNANPCLAPDAGFVAAARQTGLGFDDIVERIMEDALRRSAQSTTVFT